MDALLATGRSADVPDYLAAERTLSAWIRTSLSLMGFGFLVARFGLFLEELPAAHHTPAAHRYGLLCVWDRTQGDLHGAECR
jgi:putative membrane protein